MAWVKLDDGFFNNQKIVSVSKDAKVMYLAALCHAGATLSDGFIPKNAVPILAAQCDVRNAGKAVGELVAARLWVPSDGGYNIHDYLAHNQSSEKVQANKEAARERMDRVRSEKVRANKQRTSREVQKSSENVRLTDTDIDIESSFSDEKEPPKPPATKVADGDPRFAEFWDSYPKKVDKERSRKAFSRIRWRDVRFEDLMAALDRHKQSAQWTKDNGEFIPHPATWINNARWTDNLMPSAPASPGNPIAEPQGYSRDPDEADRQMRRDLEEMQRQALNGSEGQIVSLRRGA